MVLSWLRSNLRLQSSNARAGRRGAAPSRQRKYQLQLESLERREVPATATWTGFGLNNFWTTPQNWLNNDAPDPNDDLVFPATALQQATMFNDMPVATPFNSITLQGTGYNLQGVGILLKNGINDTHLTGTNTVSLFFIGLTGNQTWNNTMETSTLTVNSPISMGNNSLTFTGTGITNVSGAVDSSTGANVVKNDIGQVNWQNNSPFFNGNIVINNGVFQVNQQTALGTQSGVTTVNDGGTLLFNAGTYIENITARGQGFGGQGALNTQGAGVLNGALSVPGDIVIGVNNASTLTFNGVVNESVPGRKLTKVGNGGLTFSNNVLLTGPTAIDAGTLTLNTNGTLATTGIVVTTGGILTIDNQATPLGDRIPDATPISLTAASFNFLGRTGTDVSERVGTITLAGGHNQFTLNSIAATASTFLMLSTPKLDRSPGATAQFNFVNLALGTFNATTGNRFLIDTPPAVQDGSAVPPTTPPGSGILPYATVLNNGANSEPATYAATPVPLIPPAGITFIQGITAFGNAQNIPLPAVPSLGYATGLTSAQVPTVADPGATTPAVSLVAGSTALPAGNYQVKYTAYNGVGQTLPSTNFQLFTLVSPGTTQPQFTLPALPAGATGFMVYLERTSGPAVPLQRYNLTPVGAGAFNFTFDFPGGSIPVPVANTTSAANIGGTTNVRYTAAAAETITTSTTVNSLTANAGGTITINPGVTLTLRSGMLISTGAAALTITGGGVLQLDSANLKEAFLLGTLGANINVPITGLTLDNGLTVATNNAVATTFGGNLANTYRGTTRLNAGTLTLAKTVAGLIAVPGDLVVGDGSGGVASDVVNANVLGSLLFVTDPTTVPTVNVTGGGTTGGLLAAGNYFLKYTYVVGNGGETLASPESLQFTVPSDAIPRVNVGVLPAGVTGVKIYLTDVGGMTNTETFYASFVAGVNIDLAADKVPSVVTPPTLNTANPNITVLGGATLNLPNASGTTTIGNLTLQSSSSTGPGTAGGNAAVATQANTLVLNGNLSVLAPITTSFLFAGSSTITGTTAAAATPVGNIRLASIGGVNRIFNIENGAAVYDAIISAIVATPTNTVTLTKSGLGALLFTNSNSYNGPTVVSQGILTINGNQPLSAVSVLPGARLNGGVTTTTGTLLNANFASGTVVEPGATPGVTDFAGNFGNTAPNFVGLSGTSATTTRGILTSQGGATFQTGSSLILEIAQFNAANADYDRFLVGGALNIQPGVSLVLDLKGLFLAGQPGGGTSPVITYVSRSGKFSDVQTINNPFGFVPVLKYNAGSLDIIIQSATVPVPNQIVVVGPAKNHVGDIKVYNAVSRAELYTIHAFTGTAAVEVATGDVNGDGIQDVIAAQAGLIRTFDGTTGKQFTTAIGQFRPFGTAFKGRVYLGAGRLDSDGSDDIAAGRGAGTSTVRAWASTPPVPGFSPTTYLANFVAYKGSTTGVRVAVGQFDGTGTEEIYTAPGAQRAMVVNVYGLGTTPPTLLASRAPYGNGYKGGGYLAAGDFNNDGKDDIVVGPGGTSPGQQVVVMDAANLAGPFLAQFPPFLGFNGAIRVGVSDENNDGILDILATRANTSNKVGFFDLLGSEQLPQIAAFEPTFAGGLTIAGGSNI